LLRGARTYLCGRLDGDKPPPPEKAKTIFPRGFIPKRVGTWLRNTHHPAPPLSTPECQKLLTPPPSPPNGPLDKLLNTPLIMLSEL